MKFLRHTLVQISEWLCETTTFLSCQEQLCSQRAVSVHVSLNDNELLLTPPPLLFCVFRGMLPSKTKLIYCVLSGSKVPFKESLFTRRPYLQRFQAAQTRPSPIEMNLTSQKLPL